MSSLNSFLHIAHDSPEASILKLLIELGAQFVGAAEGSLLVADEEAGDLVFAMTVGSDTSADTLAGQRVPAGKGVVGLAAQTHEVQIGAPTFGTQQSMERSSGPSSVLAAPMLINDRLVGVITAVSFDEKLRFSLAHATLFGRIAAVAGIVVDQQRRLAAVDALQQGAALPDAISEDERTDREIADTVQRLVRAHPESKQQIAQLLATIEQLASD